MTISTAYSYISSLPWKERVNECKRIHEEFKAKDSSWAVVDSARELGLSSFYLGKILDIANNLHRPELQTAKNINHAWIKLEAKRKIVAEETVKKIKAITENLLDN